MKSVNIIILLLIMLSIYIIIKIYDQKENFDFLAKLRKKIIV